MSQHIDFNDTFTRAMQEMAGANYDRSVALLNGILATEADHKLALAARGAAFLKSGQNESDQKPRCQIFPEIADGKAHTG